MKYRNVETLLIHAGADEERPAGSVGTPIFQTTTFDENATDGAGGVRYTRLGNGPNQLLLERRLAMLSGGDDAIMTASGMAAVAMTLGGLCGHGDRIVVQRGIYGGTSMLMQHDLARFGIACDAVDGDDPGTWDTHVTSSTRVVYVEAITNPLARIIDHRAVIAFAKRHGLVAVIDATFATPINFRPLDLGFDLELHSVSKYLNGHTDVIAGAIIGRQSLIDRIRPTFRNMGPALDPHAAFLVERGLKTLVLRVRQQNQTALQLARWFVSRDGIARVHHPGLAPEHAVPMNVRNDFRGFGGVFAIDVAGGARAAVTMLKALRIATWAPSLGGTETLVTRPAGSSHAGLTPEARAAIGITDGTVRIACGLEGTEDLIADFDQALQATTHLQAS